MPRGNPNWVTGVSGNPGGRPKGINYVRGLARQHTDECINLLASVVRSEVEKTSNRIMAAQILLDKAHIATIPGAVFGAQGEGHLRFGYSCPMETIEGALASLKKAKLT